MHPIVGVHARDDVRLGAFDSLFERGDQASRRLRVNAETWVFPSRCSGDLQRSVLRSIIEDEALSIPHSLSGDTVERRPEGSLRIADGQQD
jgi:hypothetical protein